MEKKESHKSLLNGEFIPVNVLKEGIIPDQPGIYCIKLKDDVTLPYPFDSIRKDRIIYIGISESSLKKRLWDQELNHKSPATFFRSIGAILGFRPPKGSLRNKKNKRNYKFSLEDTKKIITWMHNSLLVNWETLPEEELKSVEERLIWNLCPLINISKNPNKSIELEKLRKECVEIANSI